MSPSPLRHARDRVLAALGPLNFDDPNRNGIRDLWDRLSPLPGGKILFSKVLGRAVRYTGSIDGRVLELRVGYGRAQIKDVPRLRNHLRSVHAIALANLAEMTGNLAVSYSLPNDARFIVGGLTMEYVKKARGTITAEANPPVVTTSEKAEYPVVVTMTDPSGEVVARCTLKTVIGPKKKT